MIFYLIFPQNHPSALLREQAGNRARHRVGQRGRRRGSCQRECRAGPQQERGSQHEEDFEIGIFNDLLLVIYFLQLYTHKKVVLDMERRVLKLVFLPSFFGIL